MNNVGKDQTEVYSLRFSVKYMQMLDAISERTGQNRNALITSVLIDYVERTNTNTVLENSKMNDLNNDLKDFLSMNISKIENRIASLLAHGLITGYEIREMNEEVLRLIVGQLYEAPDVDGIIEEAKRKVNTAAIVKIKNQPKLSQLLK